MKDYNQIWPHSALLYRLLAPEVIMSVIMTGTNLESGRVYRVNQHRPVVSERKVKYTGGTAMEIVVITGSTRGIGYGLADRVEVVTPWLAKQVLANRKNGVVISWLTRRKALIRFLLAPFRRRELFDS